MAKINKLKKVPVEVLEWYNKNFPRSEGYNWEYFYWYWGSEYISETDSWKDVKYYGIAVTQYGKICSYPQDTLQGFANGRYDGQFKQQN